MKHLKSLPAMGAIAATSALGVLLTAGAAEAVPAPPPQSFPGNVTTCSAAGLSGDILFGQDIDGMGGDDYPPPPQPSGTGTVSDNGIFVDVTINAGFTASGVVVKGGPNYNVYSGPFVGPITIEDMRSPVNPGMQDPEISHWFVCGGAGVPTPSGPAKTGGGGSQPISGWITGGAALLVALPIAGALIWRKRYHA